MKSGENQTNIMHLEPVRPSQYGTMTFQDKISGNMLICV